MLILQAAFVVVIAMEEYFLAFGILLGLVSFVFIFSGPTNGLIILPIFLYLPFEVPGFGGIQFSEIGTFLVLLVGLFSVMLVKRDLEFETPAVMPLILIFIAYCLSVLNAKYFAASVKDIVKFIESFFILFLFTINFVDKRETITNIFRVFIFAGLISSIIGIVRYFAGLDSRVFGLSGGDFGAFLGISTLSAISNLIFSSSKVEKALVLASLPILVSAMILSQTRAWLLGLMLALFLLFLQVRRDPRAVRFAFLLAAIAIVVFVLLSADFFSGHQANLITSGVSRAFETGIIKGETLGRYVSILMRIFVWVHCFSIYLQNPIFGFGIGNLRIRNYFTGELGSPYEEGVGYIDNHWLNVLYETGILGVVGWIWLAVVVYKACRQLMKVSIDPEWKQISITLAGSMLILLVGGMFWVLTVVHELTALIPFLIGLIFASTRIIDKQHERAT